jgi:hypothetical protein
MPSKALMREAAEAANQLVNDTVQLSSFRVPRFGRHRDGYFHGEVSLNGETFYVSCQWGSWQLPVTPGAHAGREILSPFCDQLAEMAHDFEARERRNYLTQREAAMATAVDAMSAITLLLVIGYNDDEIADAVSAKFGVQRAKVCGMVRHQRQANQSKSQEG